MSDLRKVGAALSLMAMPMVASPAWSQEASVPVLITKSGTVGAPPAGKGQVVFFRPGSLMGAELGCKVYDHGSQIARLGSGKYYVVAVDPGKRAYSTKGERRDSLNLKPDETYFVRCNIGAGVMTGSANLSPSDRAAFAAKAKKLTMWKGPKDAPAAGTTPAQ